MKNTWGVVSLDGVQKCAVSESFWALYFWIRECFSSLDVSNSPDK